jgi:hypothetical protein
MKRIISSVVVLILIAVLSAGAGEKLRYKFVKGKTYRYDIQMDNKTNGTMGGMEFTAESKFMLVTALTAEGLTVGGIELIAVLEKATARINLPMMGMRDSTMEMKEFLGKRVKLVLSDMGKVASITAIDSFGRGPMTMMLGGSPTELFRRLMLILPEQSVEMNGAWKETLPDTVKMGNMKTISKPNIEFRIAGQEKRGGMNCWKIMISGSTAIEGSGSMRGMDVTIDGTAKISGTAFFAPNEGLMTEYDASTEMEQTQTFVGEQSGAQTMTTIVKNGSKLLK